ncbi:MAG: DUF4173 domain-containing protein [Blautia sp.]|nr:DUF4173 domain-containing protein [Blautia sp.]
MNENMNTNMNTNMNMNAAMNANEIAENQRRMNAKAAETFRRLGLPTGVYALLYTVCLYNNFSSITMPVFVVITFGYVFYLYRNLRDKIFSVFCMAGMLLLGISTACTGSTALLWMNNAGIFLLLVTMLLCQCCDTKRWTLSKGFLGIAQVVFGAVGEIGEPFTDMSCYRKAQAGKRSSKTIYILVGVGISVPLLAVILVLLYYADAVFANLIDTVFSPGAHAGTAFGVACTFFYAFFAAYCGLRYLHLGKISSECRDYRRFEPLVANTVLTLVAAVYLVFSLIQILYLFWGGMELPEGYTYAAYAREGFFQLLFVCILNVAIVLFFMGCFRESRYKNVMLTVISLCTYIMLASSAMRMCLYVQAYQLTFLRIFVLWMLALLAVFLIGVMASIYRKDFPIFRYTVIVVTVCTLCFTCAHPDYWIAKYNLAGGEVRDACYLTRLSADAAPAIAGQEGEWVTEYAGELEDELAAGGLHYNFSRARAGRLLAGYLEE